MQEFVTLVSKIFPLYLIIGAGFFAGKKLKVDREAVATILIYIIAPVVIFYGVATTPTDGAYLLLPVIFFIISCLIGTLFYLLGGWVWDTAEKNILGFSAGTGNTGYFGLPLILALLGPSAQSVAIISILGFILFESTLGYYFISKGQATAQETVKRVLKLPFIYAFLLGLFANVLNVLFSGSILDTFVYFRGAYVVFGMMIIGIGLAF